MQYPSSGEGRAVVLAGLAAVFIALFARFIWSFSYLPGTDAYYYALQAQSILDHGHLKVPDRGAVHYLVAGVALLGPAVETSCRMVLSAIFALYQLGILLVVMRLRPWAQPMAALLWGLSCPLVAFHTVEFPSLTLGVATLPLWLWLATKPGRLRMFCLILLLAASGAIHAMAAVLALLFAGTLAIVTLLRRLGMGRGLIVAGCVLLAMATAVSLTFKSRLMEFRLGLPGVLGLSNGAGIPREVTFTILFAWLLLAAALVVYCKTGFGRWTFLAAAALALPLWPDGESGIGGMGGRLALLFVLLALPLAMALGIELQERTSFHTFFGAGAQGLATAGVLIAVALLPLRLQTYRGLLMADDYAAYERVVADLRDRRIPMLIAHRGLDFFYSFRLRRDAFHFDPEPGWDRAEIWRVAARITPEEVAYYSPPQCSWGQSAWTIRVTGYVIVREDCWEQMRAQVTRDENPDLYTEIWDNMENPSQARPDFLRARHRDLHSGPFSSPPGEPEGPR